MEVSLMHHKIVGPIKRVKLVNYIIAKDNKQ